MSEKFNNFCSELRTRINDADKRIKDLKASALGASEKAGVEARAQLVALENKAKEQKARTAATEAKAKAWVEEKKTMTHDKIAQWKEQRDAKRLAARADLSEHYATTAMEIAASAVDEAERAAVEAVVARMDADGVKAPAASKSA
jgi:membrane protein involved in colicin uptake